MIDVYWLGVLVTLPVAAFVIDRFLNGPAAPRDVKDYAVVIVAAVIAALVWPVVAVLVGTGWAWTRFGRWISDEP